MESGYAVAQNQIVKCYFENVPEQTFNNVMFEFCQHNLLGSYYFCVCFNPIHTSTKECVSN